MDHQNNSVLLLLCIFCTNCFVKFLKSFFVRTSALQVMVFLFVFCPKWILKSATDAQVFSSAHLYFSIDLFYLTQATVKILLKWNNLLCPSSFFSSPFNEEIPFKVARGKEEQFSAHSHNASSLRFSFVVIEGPIACQFDAAKWDLLEGEIMNGEKTESNFGCFCCQILEGIAI